VAEGAIRAKTKGQYPAPLVALKAIRDGINLPLDEARAINVDGTARVLDFAVEAQAREGLDRFLHVSTAYVCGRYEGTFRERQLDAGQTFRNTYEETKADAEQIVTLARELGPAIARPSIVVGESDSGWTPAFNVLYWPLRAFSRGMFKSVPARAEGRVDEYAYQLSGGLRQRAMIAMALAADPKLLIADEPTTALDVTTQSQILELLRELQERTGMAIMLITHDLGVIAEMADDVVVMYLGRVVEEGPVDQIFHSPQHPCPAATRISKCDEHGLPS